MKIQVSYLQFTVICQNLTPLSRPVYIEIENGEPSPYLKELLSKVGTSQIEFMDFTLEGGEEEEECVQQLPDEAEMSVIEQQSERVEGCADEQEKPNKYEYNPDEYIPNMHLLQLPPSTLNIDYFCSMLDSLKAVSQQQRRQFVLLYLTDHDLSHNQNAAIDILINVAKSNLSSIGIISKLERKGKVARYLQKKKKRIWRKKINYDCRKKVADGRLRIKGKFVTDKQAREILGVNGSRQQLRQLLGRQSQR